MCLPKAIDFPTIIVYNKSKWEDSVGPKELRPARPELAWGVIENNHFGLDEFVDWAKKADTDIMKIGRAHV